jgi:hypothetical protein
MLDLSSDASCEKERVRERRQRPFERGERRNNGDGRRVRDEQGDDKHVQRAILLRPVACSSTLGKTRRGICELCIQL